jgi:hypothetical protein
MIHLFIPDTALRDAIAEQLVISKMPFASDKHGLADALKDDAITAIVLDEAGLDKKNLVALAEATPGHKTVFLLGTGIAGTPNDVISESFPKPLRLGYLLVRLSYYCDVAPRLRGVVVTLEGMRFESQNRQLVNTETEAITRLTEKETALLAYLAQSRKSVSREELLAAIWGYDATIDTHTLESHIYQLRRKLDPEGKGLDILINETSAYRLKQA